MVWEINMGVSAHAWNLIRLCYLIVWGMAFIY